MQRYKTIFTVSTRSSDSSDIEDLKKAIQELMEKEWYDIPLVWFNLKEQIRDSQKQHEKIPKQREKTKEQPENTLTLQTVHDIGRKINIHDLKQIEAALVFFHAVGDLVFFKELPECIVMDPQWLIDQFKMIITIKTNDNRACSPLWGQVDDYGYLRGKLLEEICPGGEERSHMIELMKKFALLLPVKDYWQRNAKLKRPENEDEVEYLVPCLLHPVKIPRPRPMVLRACLLPAEQEEIDVYKPLVLSPVCDFIPAGLTGRLMSSLCIEERWKICGPAHANEVTFELEDGCQIKLCMKSSPKQIEIRCTRSGDRPLCESLQKIADRIAKLPGTVGFDVCLQCPHVEETSRLGTLSKIHEVVEQNRPICDHDGTKLRDSEYSAWFFDSTSTGRNAFSICSPLDYVT